MFYLNLMSLTISYSYIRDVFVQFINEFVFERGKCIKEFIFLIHCMFDFYLLFIFTMFEFVYHNTEVVWILRIIFINFSKKLFPKDHGFLFFILCKVCVRIRLFYCLP